MKTKEVKKTMHEGAQNILRRKDEKWKKNGTI